MAIEYRTEPEYIEYLDGEASRSVRAITKNGERCLSEGERFVDEVPWLTFDVSELFADLDIPKQ